VKTTEYKQELRKMSRQELAQLLHEKRKELMYLEFEARQKGARRRRVARSSEVNYADIHKCRKDVARLMTEITSR